MFPVLFVVLLSLRLGFCELWPNGVVHYTISNKDYDLHSQDIILSTIAEMQKEICVKFFGISPNFNATNTNKVLYINNEDKRKTCQKEIFDYSKNIVNMPIGYKCLNQVEITRIIVDMLKASIEGTMSPINSYDLIKKFQEKDEDPSRTKLLSAKDRNFINAHYHNECSALTHLPAVESRRFQSNIVMSKDNEMFYKDKVWPLGIIMYTVENSLRNSPLYLLLKFAMVNIQLSTCVIFREMNTEDQLVPKNMLWFGKDGADMPALGFMEGVQKISLESMVKGAPGHTAHTLNALLRALGIPMMSNRHDRDNYVTILWNHIQKGKEHYFEKNPPAATLTDQDGAYVAYTFESATHAPANFMCADCSMGGKTILPVQDHLWQRTMMMGHRNDLTSGDISMVNHVYSNECQKR